MQLPRRRLRSPPCRRQERRWFDRGRLSLANGHADTVVLGVGTGTGTRQTACRTTQELGSYARAKQPAPIRMASQHGYCKAAIDRRQQQGVRSMTIARRKFLAGSAIGVAALAMPAVRTSAATRKITLGGYFDM